jgi:hypothetical protein
MDGASAHISLHVFNMQHSHTRTSLIIAHSSSRSENVNVYLPVKCLAQNIPNVAEILVFAGAVYVILAVVNV